MPKASYYWDVYHHASISTRPIGHVRATSDTNARQQGARKYGATYGMVYVRLRGAANGHEYPGAEVR